MPDRRNERDERDDSSPSGESRDREAYGPIDDSERDAHRVARSPDELEREGTGDGGLDASGGDGESGSAPDPTGAPARPKLSTSDDD